MKRIKLRILASISGNLVVQAINTLIQLLGIPLLIKYWGIEYYGEWLLLFTIPSYIAMSDLGLGNSTTSELSMLIQAKRIEESKYILRNTFWFVILIGGIPFMLLLLSLFVLPWYDWLNLSAIPYTEFKPALVFLTIYIYLALFLTVPLGYYRAQQIYHRERYISSFFRVFEFLLIIWAVVAGFKIIMVAFIYFLVRLMQLIFVFYDLSRRFEAFNVFPFGLNIAKVKHLIKPGLSAMTISLGQNLMVQGLVTVIGIWLGSAQVVLFSTTRTLVNAVKQVINIVNLSITSEFSYAYGEGNFTLMRKLFNLTSKANVLLSASLLTILFFAGSWIIDHWTNGKVEIIQPFYTLILIGVFINTSWNVHGIMLVSTNKLGRTGFWYLISATLLISFDLIWIKKLNITGVAASIIIFELLIYMIMVTQSKKVLYPDQNFKLPIGEKI